MADFRAELTSALGTLTGLLAKYTPRKEHFMSDVVLHGYARDGYTHAQSVLLLAESLFPRASYVNARAAFEAAQDALLLVSDEATYDDNAALAYCIELVEHQELQMRWKDASAQWNILKENMGKITPEELIEKEAPELDKLSAGTADRFRKALAEARRPRRAHRHWSGMSRQEISEALEKRIPAAKGAGAGGDAFYGMLSVQAHPRVRSWSEERYILPDGSLQARRGPEHTALPVGLTLFAVGWITAAVATQMGDKTLLNKTA